MRKRNIWHQFPIYLHSIRKINILFYSLQSNLIGLKRAIYSPSAGGVDGGHKKGGDTITFPLKAIILETRRDMIDFMKLFHFWDIARSLLTIDHLFCATWSKTPNAGVEFWKSAKFDENLYLGVFKHAKSENEHHFDQIS